MKILSRLCTGVAIVTLMVVGAGCGDNDQTIFLGDQTPTPRVTPARTATPAGATATAAITATPGDANPTPTATPGGVASDAATITRTTLPFLTIGVGFITGVSSASAPLSATRTLADAQQIDDCPDGGTREEENDGTFISITLDACRVSNPDLGSFEAEGTIDVDLLEGTIDFDVTITDLGTGDSADFVGTLQGTPNLLTGGFVLNGGPIDVFTDAGDFVLNFSALTIDGNGNLVSGAASAEDIDDVYDVQVVQMTVNAGGNTADVLVTFDDQTTATFLLDLKTGALTPTS
jgi:hypothetical protein